MWWDSPLDVFNPFITSIPSCRRPLFNRLLFNTCRPLFDTFRTLFNTFRLNVRFFSGHVHLTDFNIATVLDDESSLATSMSGTKPYIAPEIFDCALDIIVGYSYAVDWWSLGVVAYEVLNGSRPFDIHSNTGVQEVRILYQLGVEYPCSWSDNTVDLISRVRWYLLLQFFDYTYQIIIFNFHLKLNKNIFFQLLRLCPGSRVSSLKELKHIKCLQKYDMDLVFQRQYTPTFQPPVIWYSIILLYI